MNSKVCIIGDIVTDVSLPNINDEIKLRLGGLTHCARGLWSLNASYDAMYFAPQYLKDDLEDYFKHHGAIQLIELGDVNGAPYVFLIGDSKETGNQGYEFLLRDNIRINYNNSNLKCLDNYYEEVLLISGNYDLEKVLKKIRPNIDKHIDFSNNISQISQLKDYFFQTIFISTSSELFLDNYDGNFRKFSLLFQKNCSILVLKENRGGSRIYDFKEKKEYNIPSLTQPISHSVGVGDVFDACFVSNYKKHGVEKAGYLSSWVASEYAFTSYPDDFKKNTERILKMKIEDLMSLGGCILPWENRKNINIYIAAPDFDYVDTSKIDQLVDALNYHNFKPRCPIRENGQLTFESKKEERIEAFSKDLKLINHCNLLIVVYINDDPGTMIELGFAKALGKPCLVYDPYKKAYNCMLTEIPNLITSNLDEIISEVFNLSSL